MKRALRIAALVVFLAGIGVWLACGQNLGWTKTTMGVKKVDPVTQIDYQEQQKGFWPGVDFLAVVTLAAAGLFGGSFLFRKKN